MKTTHKIIFGNSNNISEVPSNSVDLMITSPPYPMIEMWDEMFGEQNPQIKEAIAKEDGVLAFELMNQELDKVWDEVYRVLKDGGIACINIGDATRSINGKFQLFPSHSRIVNHCLKIGFHSLPEILWRKQTNAPNKFMGSGMLPPGAYVTLEHEYILIFRKTGKREFKKEHEKTNRQKSSFFWEERNIWFSDIWEGLKGKGQKLTDERIRNRSAAYPFELAYRLINMFSVKGDTVLDPYLGTGTTTVASMVSGRNSLGVEIDPNFKDTIYSKCDEIIDFGNNYHKKRIDNHLEFVEERTKTKGELKYENKVYKFPVMTRQELKLVFRDLTEVKKVDDNLFEAYYESHPNESIIIEKSTRNKKDSIKTKLAKSLARKGIKNPMYGKKGKINPNFGRKNTSKTLRKMREARIKSIIKSLSDNVPIMPQIGNYETSILNNLEKCFGYPITRQKRVAGYFLDGYCSMLKLAIEVDEPRHFDINGNLRQRDAIRQKEIEKEIGCTFLRIDLRGVENSFDN